MIALLSQLWPFILAVISAIAVYISRLQVHKAKRESRVSKENEQVAIKVAEAHKAISKAVINGEAKAAKLLEEAHEEDSVSSLTKSSY